MTRRRTRVSALWLASAALLLAGCAAPDSDAVPEADDALDAVGGLDAVADAEAEVGADVGADVDEPHADASVLGPPPPWQGNGKRKWRRKWKTWGNWASPDAGGIHHEHDAGSTDGAASDSGAAQNPACAEDADAGPMPTPTCAPPETTLFVGKPVPEAQTLEVEIGHFEGDAFVPWQPGQARPMVHGPQGGLHVVAAARVRRKDGEPLASGAMWLEQLAEVGCNKVSKQKIAWLKTGAAPGEAGARLLPDKGGVWLVLPAPAAFASQWCGTWLRVTLRAKVKGTSDWGGASVHVHLIDP